MCDDSYIREDLQLTYPALHSTLKRASLCAGNPSYRCESAASLEPLKAAHGVLLLVASGAARGAEAGSELGLRLLPVLKASGCKLIVFAPRSKARCVLAMYSSRDGAARSVLTLSRPSWYVTPRDWRVVLVDVVEDDTVRVISMNASSLSAPPLLTPSSSPIPSDEGDSHAAPRKRRRTRADETISQVDLGSALLLYPFFECQERRAHAMAPTCSIVFIE